MDSCKILSARMATTEYGAVRTPIPQCPVLVAHAQAAVNGDDCA